MRQAAKKINWRILIFYLSLLLSLGILLVASVGYQTAFMHYLHLPYYLLAILVLMPALILRLVKLDCYLKKIFWPWHLTVLVVLLVLLTLAVSSHFFIYPNFFFATFHLDPLPLFALSVLVYLLLFFYRHKWRQHWHLLAYLTPILIIIFAFLVMTQGYGIFAHYFANEDTWIEYAQFFFYLTASILSLMSSRLLANSKKSFWSIIYLLIALAFFVVAGEEISWGQRLLGFQTPEAIKNSNTQGELNIHNNNLIFGYVYRVYLLIAAYGSFAWMGKSLIADRLWPKSKKMTPLLVPAWYWSSAFLFSLVMFYFHRTKHLYNLQIYEEFNEFIFSGVLLAFFMENYFLIKKNKINVQKK